MPTILTISLGPVQGFIAAARKTQDLWFGSTMLSAVARQVAETLQQTGATMIFPSAAALQCEQAGIANKIVAILPAEVDPANFARQAKTAARKRLDIYYDNARKRVTDARAEQKVKWDLLEAQLAEFLECYTAWTTADNYQDARQQAEQLLAGRKGLRDFAPACGVDGVPKSSLDGGREAVLDTESLSRDQQIQLGIKKGELLDGISLLKRLGEKTRFPSTARIAADPTIRQWATTNPTRLTDLSKLMEQAIHCELAQRFPQDVLPQYAIFPYDTQLLHSAAVSKDEDHEMAKKVFQLAGNGSVPSYYAIIQADGDHMGQAIDELQTPEAHRQLSDALVDFAQQAGKIVAENQGTLVYSGGDDVLGMLPLDMALACADLLRQAFTNAISRLNLTHPPTLSVGISIAHFSANLQSQLDWARKAERIAKDNGRNSLAITMRTRGNAEAPVIVVHSWENNPVESLWQPLILALQQNAISPGVAYELRQLADDFRNNEDITSAAIAGEVQRVIDRKRQTDGKNISKSTRETLQMNVQTIAKLDELVSQILIARHLVRVSKEVTDESA